MKIGRILKCYFILLFLSCSGILSISRNILPDYTDFWVQYLTGTILFALILLFQFKKLEGDTDIPEASLQTKMSNLFGKLTRTLGWGPQPTKVLHSQWQECSLKKIVFQEGMFLVVPLAESYGDADLKLYFEVIVQAEINSTKQAYSLLRTVEDCEAIEHATKYSKLFPCLIESCGKEFLNLSTLQKVLDVCREKPSWNSAHLVACFGLVDALKNEKVLKLLEVSESHRGSFPIHVAVEYESEKVVNHFLLASDSIEVYDKSGNSPLHIAASKTITLINTLKPRRQTCLNTKNAKGETPLLIAAKADCLDNVKCLIQLGANLNHEPKTQPNLDTESYHEKLKILENSRDISHKALKKGGTLLHWVKTREMTNVALDMGCVPNSLNDFGQSPLHVMVERGHLNCLMTLLTKGAIPNLSNNEGNSPLHIAASMCSVSMVQALVCFGAQINAFNRLGETPRHLASNAKIEDKNKQGDKEKVIYLLHAVGAIRCRVKLASCGEGCTVGGSFNGVPIYEKPLLRSRWVFDDYIAKNQIDEAVKYQTLYKSDKKGGGRVLCLDGGGIKGLVLCQMLDVIKQILGQSITESFDWIAGTSTGGFLALNLASGKSVQHSQSLYYSLKDRVFAGTRPYDTNDLETMLKEEYGEETMMSSIERIKVNVTTTLADRLPADLHLFRNYEAPIDVLGIGESSDFEKPPPPHRQKIWLAARASGAAPTYFNSTDKYLDGGMVANNPVLDVMTEIEEWNMAVRAAGREDEVFVPTVIVSLGCGKSPVVKVDNVDLTLPSILDMRRGFQAIYNMFNLLVEQAVLSEGRVIDRARAWCASSHVPLFRLNPEFSEDCSIDEHDDVKLIKIMWETRAYMGNQIQLLDTLKPLLLNAEGAAENKTPFAQEEVPLSQGAEAYFSQGAAPFTQEEAPFPQGAAAPSMSFSQVSATPVALTRKSSVPSTPSKKSHKFAGSSSIANFGQSLAEKIPWESLKRSRSATIIPKLSEFSLKNNFSSSNSSKKNLGSSNFSSLKHSISSISSNLDRKNSRNSSNLVPEVEVSLDSEVLSIEVPLESSEVPLESSEVPLESSEVPPKSSIEQKEEVEEIVINTRTEVETISPQDSLKFYLASRSENDDDLNNYALMNDL